MAYTGLRPSDILTITGKDIDFPNRVLKYYSPKRKKFREIAFHEKLVPILRKRIKEIGKGKLLDYNEIGNLGKALRRYLKDIQLNGRNYSVRTFRKTFITLCRSRYDMDALIVMELVGHEHRNTTDRYYNQISINKMREELKKFRLPTIKKKK